MVNILMYQRRNGENGAYVHTFVKNAIVYEKLFKFKLVKIYKIERYK